MPRPKKQKDDAEEKMPKPKVLFKMNFQIYDNGIVDCQRFERYLNEDTGRWNQETRDTPKEFREAVEDEICEKPEFIASMMLKAIGMDPNEFARCVMNVPQSSLLEKEIYNSEDDEDEDELEEELE